MSDQPLHVSLVTVIDAQAMTDDRTGTVQDIKNIRSYAVQAVWSAGSTPVGVFYVQGSLDGSTYTNITSQAVSGNSGSFLCNVELPAYLFLRTFYDYTSGTGTLNVYVSLKR